MNIHPERKWTIILTPGGGTEEVLILKGSNDEDTTEWYDMLKRTIVIAFKKKPFLIVFTGKMKNSVEFFLGSRPEIISEVQKTWSTA